MERIESLGEMDGRYHVAKLTAAAFNDPARIWDEHEAMRHEWFTPAPAQRLTPDLLARAAALFKRAREAEARHGAH